MEECINQYFEEYFHGVEGRFNKNNLKNIIDPLVISAADEIAKCCEEKLSRVMTQNIYFAMAIHIDAAIKRIRLNKKIVNPQLQKIRTEHTEEFNMALSALSIVENVMDVSLPIDEAGFLTMFFIVQEENCKNEAKDTGVIVIAHGSSTATSMTEVANCLLGTNYAEGINAPLEESPYAVLEKVKKCISNLSNKSGFLFLVDMGSLTTFGDIIENETGVPVKVIPMVSTLHVLEATRKAMLGYSLDEIYEDVCCIASSDKKSDTEEGNKLVIITLCTTGEGSALIMRDFLKSHLKLDSEIFEIVPLNIVGKENIIARIRKINKVKKVIAVVSSFKLNLNIPQFTIEEVLNLSAIRRIQFIADVENTYIKMGETLKYQLKNVDGELLFEDIKKCISDIENEWQNNVDMNGLIGIAMHIGCMVDRLISGETIVPYENKDKFIKEQSELYGIIKDSTTFFNEKYDIIISDDEICYIVELFTMLNA